MYQKTNQKSSPYFVKIWISFTLLILTLTIQGCGKKGVLKPIEEDRVEFPGTYPSED